MAGYLERLKSKKTATHGTAKTAKRPFDSKDSDRGRHISEKTPEIPSPEPPGMGPEYDHLWNEAWRLADWIDDPDGAPIEDRRAKLPELEQRGETGASLRAIGRQVAAEVEKYFETKVNPDTIRKRAERSSGTNVPKSKNPTITSDSEEIKQIKPPGTWHTWESTEATTRDRNPESCPARCRRTGKCYALAYFKGKPGPAKDCEPDGCIHISNERGKQ
jgi:hypothetical protein